MLIVVSPAKTLDYETPVSTAKFSQPAFLPQSEALVNELRALSAEDISALMKVSQKIGEENFFRFLNFSQPFTPDNARQAIFAFKGDVYTGLNVADFKAADLDYAQKHLRILSGLYGLLRPLDLMQPYRLEMGTKFSNAGGKDLYAFWGNRITEALNQAIAEQRGRQLVNLASNEYFKAVNTRQLDAELITPVFKDYKNGTYKIISFFAKKARGRMAAWILQERVSDPEALKAFDRDGYHYSPADSRDGELVFHRKAE